MNSADQALCLADAVGPDCGICLDTFHMNIEEVDMYAAIRKRRKRHLPVRSQIIAVPSHETAANSAPSGDGRADHAQPVPDRPEPILALLPQLRGLPGDDLPWLEDAIVANLTQAAAQRPPVVALAAPTDGYRTHAE